MSARTFPMPEFPAERPAGGWCRWCGDATSMGRNGRRRSWHDGRQGEPDCLLEFYLHTRRDQQFRHVQARDTLRCWDCREAPMKWTRGCETIVLGGFIRGVAQYPDRVRYCETEYVTALELEHEVPLWAVAHLPPDERRPFFGPTNLRLRCPPCHKLKTKREAGQRAAYRRNPLLGGLHLAEAGLARALEPARPLSRPSAPPALVLRG